MTKPWLKFYDPGVPAILHYPQDSLVKLFEKSANEFSDHIAIVFGELLGGRLLERKISYHELNNLIDRLAAGLQSLGVNKGDRVGVFLPNCPQFIISYYAILKCGGIVVPCNPLFVARELHHQLYDSGVKVFIALSNFSKIVSQAISKTNVGKVIFTDIEEFFHPLHKFLYRLRSGQAIRNINDKEFNADIIAFADLLKAPPVNFSSVATALDEVAVFMYTGGTTGIPKAAMLSQRNLIANAIMATHWVCAHRGREVILTTLPLFHSYGMTICMNYGLLNGGQLVLILRPKKTLHILKAIQKYQVTLFPAVPAIFQMVNELLQKKKFDLHSLRLCTSGAAALNPEVQEAFQKLTGVKLLEGYGLSEAAPGTHCNPVEHNRPGTIGIPWPDTEAKIMDLDTGTRELPPGENGELVIRGPQIMQGYWNMPDETTMTLRNGWLYTGDIARMDEDGYFQIIDRKKDMIITGGFNVYPREIEEVLYEHPAIKESTAVGIPDVHYGEIVKVFVVLKEGTHIAQDEIIDFCNQRLAKYKLPKEVEFRSELPKTTVGKVLRRALLEEELESRRGRPIWVERKVRPTT